MSPYFQLSSLLVWALFFLSGFILEPIKADSSLRLWSGCMAAATSTPAPRKWNDGLRNCTLGHLYGLLLLLAPVPQSQALYWNHYVWKTQT